MQMFNRDPDNQHIFDKRPCMIKKKAERQKQLEERAENESKDRVKKAQELAKTRRVERERAAKRQRIEDRKTESIAKEERNQMVLAAIEDYISQKNAEPGYLT